jgi:stage IV sporulation protein B
LIKFKLKSPSFKGFFFFCFIFHGIINLLLHKLYAMQKSKKAGRNLMNRKNTKRLYAVAVAVLLLFALWAPAATAEPVYASSVTKELIPGGMAFGIKFFTEGAVILGTTGVETASGVVSPAKDAGLKSGDVIIRAGGTDFETASELNKLVSGSGGKPIVVAYIRNGEENSTTVTPAKDIESGEYRLGVLVRDSTAGLGTVTYIDPETKEFGGLGHGIYESETGVLLPLGRGAVVEVEVTGVVKSVRNSPGRLKGNFGNVAVGELAINCHQGVFGSFERLPENASGAIPIAGWDDIREGEATIQTTLQGSEIKSYTVEIEEIYENSGKTKNFLIKVTDKSLLEETGGIVQGMSGSPIIQNGRLIGAVTHVLVNDPTHGYGIAIENMLNSTAEASWDLTSQIAA